MASPYTRISSTWTRPSASPATAHVPSGVAEKACDRAVCGERGELLTRVHIQQPHCAIVSGREGLAAFREGHQLSDRPSMTIEAMYVVTGRHVPKSHCAITAGG